MEDKQTISGEGRQQLLDAFLKKYVNEEEIIKLKPESNRADVWGWAKKLVEAPPTIELETYTPASLEAVGHVKFEPGSRIGTVIKACVFYIESARVTAYPGDTVELT